MQKILYSLFVMKTVVLTTSTKRLPANFIQPEDLSRCDPRRSFSHRTSVG